MMALINHSFDLDIGLPLWCNQTHNHKKSQGHCSHISNLLGNLPYPVNIHPHLQNSSEVFHNSHINHNIRLPSLQI